jgi:hypothetical protein
MDTIEQFPAMRFESKNSEINLRSCASLCLEQEILWCSMNTLTPVSKMVSTQSQSNFD